LYAEHEAEHGRATEAIVRLLNRIPRNRNDPELYAGLVYACRYVGLLDASVMAHELAHRIETKLAIQSYKRALALRSEFGRGAPSTRHGLWPYRPPQ
jgi:hypothetical protein